jgi:hypothetical protein
MFFCFFGQNADSGPVWAQFTLFLLIFMLIFRFPIHFYITYNLCRIFFCIHHFLEGVNVTRIRLSATVYPFLSLLRWLFKVRFEKMAYTYFFEIFFWRIKGVWMVSLDTKMNSEITKKVCKNYSFSKTTCLWASVHQPCKAFQQLDYARQSN